MVDDGSTDDTSERVKKYGSRIEYLYKPNGGQASALNFGFEKARGEIVALLDADDYFFPGKLARVAEAFRQNPALGMVYHPYLEWYVQTNERRESHFPLVSGDVHSAPDLFLRYCTYPTSCVSFRRASLNPLLPIPQHIRMGADAYPVNLIPLLTPILAIPEFLTVYRIHGKNSSPAFANIYHADESQMPIETRQSRLQMWETLINAMRKWLADNGYTRKQLPARALLDCWSLYLEKERFLIKPPGRIRFFWFVVFENYVSTPVQTWKFTLFNYLSAFSVLVFGYNTADRFYKTRGTTMNALQRAMRTLPWAPHNSE